MTSVSSAGRTWKTSYGQPYPSLRQPTMKILEDLWEKMEPVIYISKDQFMQSFDGWDVVYWPDQDDPAFVAFVRGPEFHFLSTERRIPLPLRVIREFLG